MPQAHPAIPAPDVSAAAGMNPPSSKLTTQLPFLPSDENTIKDTVNTHYILSQWFPFYLINYPCQVAWKLISLSLWKIRCKWEGYHHYGVISHEMVASLLVLFMRSASLFQPANVLLWPSEGQRSRRLPQKELGISRQDFLRAWKGEASAQRKVSAARFVESSRLGLFLGTDFEASRPALPLHDHQHPACPLNSFQPLS